MDSRKFFRPTKQKILIFVVLLLFFSFVPSLPCQTTYFPFGNPGGSSVVKWGFCSLFIQDYVSESATDLFGLDLPFSVEVLIIIIFSYLLACIFYQLIKYKKTKNK